MNFPAQGGEILKGKHEGSPLRSETSEHGPVLQGLAEGATRRFDILHSPPNFLAKISVRENEVFPSRRFAITPFQKE